MTHSAYLQIILFVLLLAILTKPLGIYLYNVLDPKGKTGLEFLLKPLERFTYCLCGIDAEQEQTWKQYLFSLLIFCFIGMLFTAAILFLQPILPLNPQGFPSVKGGLNWSTAISYITNTDWQSYSPETTVSYFSQMFAMTVQNFTSAAAGIGVAAALVRGISRSSRTTLGNFWVDLTRLTYYLLLPLALVFAVVLVSEGVPQNFNNYAKAQTLESGSEQLIVQGPIASQEAVKLLGTNGGGFTKANSAHPYENPTPLSNWLQTLAMILLPASQTYYFGRSVQNQKHGWYLFGTMLVLFLVGLCAITYLESQGNPIFQKFHIDMAQGNFEGKEQRFDLIDTTLYSATTTTASCGASNASFSSFMPLSGVILLENMQVGEMIFGAVGSGLYNMIAIVIIGIFMAGLIVGKTPEYLGKKIESFEIKMAITPLLIIVFSILVPTAASCLTVWGGVELGRNKPHIFSEILYAFSSSATNNGSCFASLDSNTPWYHVTLSGAMLAGRFLIACAILALSGSLAAKKKHPPSEATFPISGATFVLLIIGTIFLFGALSFFPSLCFGPINEYFRLIYEVLS
ncbi:MAG: potassium-transporting ATPase subunit KdpA [Parachlamydiales bacterium]